jgi:translation initiation factor IF-3
MREKKRIINDEIRATKVQIVTDKWENLWEMSLSDAKIKAKELELDLMEIWKKDDVTIVKLIDYWKFLYKQKKQEQKAKQKWKAPDLKTIRITFKIWDHDLEIRKKQALKFWENLHPLKITLMLKWRENQYGELAQKKIDSFVKSLEEIYKLEGEIKRNWNIFIAMLKSKK